jgi:UbiD family decarboxylase
LDLLRREGELLDVQLPLSPALVIPEIQRRVVAQGGPALLFHRPGQSRFPLACNLYGSEKRIELAFGRRPEKAIRDLADLLASLPPGMMDLWRKRATLGNLARVGMRRVRRPPVLRETLASLAELPVPTCWPADGGPFFTLPLVYTEHPATGKGNLGMYRLQVQGERQTGMHIQIHRGAGNHLHAAESRGQDLPALVFLGGPPALTLAAIAPLPEDVPELLFASFVMGSTLAVSRPHQISSLPVVAEADFMLAGIIPAEVRMGEGPFGDHYGYYSLRHDFPIFRLHHIAHRSDAVFPATVVGRPPQEDHFLALYLQRLLAPLFPLVLKGVRDVFAYEESGVHSLAAAVVHERYPREAFTAALRVLGEGQLSLTKVLMVSEAELDPREFRSFLQHVLARMDPSRDLHILAHTSMDTLDYTGPTINRGSKAILLGLGEARFPLCESTPASAVHPHCKAARLYCPGVLVLSTAPFAAEAKLATILQDLPTLQPYRLVVLADDADSFCASDGDFLWHTFTRLEPSSDIHGQAVLWQNHVAFKAPIVFDCRMKPGYPPILEVDEETRQTVDRIWPDLGLGHA